MGGLFDGTPLEQPVTCEHCHRPRADCACPRDAAGHPCPPAHQHPRVRREKRRGKWTTIVAGLDPHATDLKAMLRDLRTALGTGGGLDDRAGEIVIQGDHRQAIVARLTAMGYQARAAGG